MGFNRSLILLPKLRDYIFYFLKKKTKGITLLPKLILNVKTARICNHEYAKLLKRVESAKSNSVVQPTTNYYITTGIAIKERKKIEHISKEKGCSRPFALKEP